ncbi:putative aconitase subunit 1 [Marinomonas pollencensis]|uniref:Putative aconitase subunit 1 n=2 Tax=Marinomonas pollencensis TaxID=491954 RepID=A0A3E0DQB2_9GAMM|nr:putative aconitase subunit 1 [Marinomonas pollencensis]
MLEDDDIKRAQRVLVHGQGAGEVLFSHEGLSLWGGVDPDTSEVIDRHHPLSGQRLAGKVLVIPCGRGSCTGSGVLMELMLKGLAPSAIIINQPEDILTLGVLVAEEMFETSIPVIEVSKAAFNDLENEDWLSVSGDLWCRSSKLAPPTTLPLISSAELTLSEFDQACLLGEHGKAHQVAMRIIIRMAQLQGAPHLIDVSQAHIDGCIYTGEAGLRFAQTLVSWGAKVAVPTSLNSISVDRQRWQKQSVPTEFAQAASDLADAYLAMGCAATYTCAPYLLATAPKQGAHIAWAESNAVVFANSVLGARSLKYPDYLDICIAITGRAPHVGCHLDNQRKAHLVVKVAKPVTADESFYPLLGYWLGKQSQGRIPAVVGLEAAQVTQDDLKALGAAFATTSSAPMFHIVGVTPEAGSLEGVIAQQNVTQVTLSKAELAAVWYSLNSTKAEQIDMVCLGNPHFSLSEIEHLTALLSGKEKADKTRVVVTCSRAVYDAAQAQGYVAPLTDFGVEWITDTCWCMIDKPILPMSAQTMMTNSGKYAHYGPGISGCGMRFGSLEACAVAAQTSLQRFALPHWLAGVSDSL